MPPIVPMDKGRIAEFCDKWRITEFSLFGSALREDFRPDSDVDVMVSFDPHAEWSLLDLAEMQEELSSIMGRDVDLVTRRGVEQSRNLLRKEAILSSAETIYEP
jgi:hypothetical protein